MLLDHLLSSSWERLHALEHCILLLFKVSHQVLQRLLALCGLLVQELAESFFVIFSLNFILFHTLDLLVLLGEEAFKVGLFSEGSALQLRLFPLDGGSLNWSRLYCCELGHHLFHLFELTLSSVVNSLFYQAGDIKVIRLLELLTSLTRVVRIIFLRRPL